MKTIQKIILALVIIFTSLSYAQNSTQNWEDLEGTWKYQDEEIEFYLVLKPIVVQIRVNKFENHLIGYSRLIQSGNVLYDNLNNETLLISKNVYSVNDILGIETLNHNPDLDIEIKENSSEGGFYVHNYSGYMHVKMEHDTNTITLHFTKPPGDVVTPESAQRREAMYANHIPELPSTWVLERVTEDEIKE